MIIVQQLMTKRPYTIEKTATVLAAYRLMRQYSIRHLPVLNQNQAVVGIITDRDVQRAMKVSQLSPIKQELSLSTELLVEDFMSWPVYTLVETSPLKTAVRQMLTQKVSGLLVENTAGELVGIITTDDILRFFLSEETQKCEVPLKRFARYFSSPLTLNEDR